MTTEALNDKVIIQQEILNIKAEQKDYQGKEASRALRKEGKIPCVVYGNNEENITISTNLRDFISLYNKGNIESKLINLDIGKKSLKTLIKEVQLHPVTDLPLHIDFQVIKEKEKVKVPLLLKFTNRASSPGIKVGGVLNIIMRNLICFCTSDKIPKYLEVNLKGRNIGDSIRISDVELPNYITPVLKNLNETIATITGRGKAKVEGEASAEAEKEGSADSK